MTIKELKINNDNDNEKKNISLRYNARGLPCLSLSIVINFKRRS